MHQCINIEAGICVARCCHHGTQWSRMVYEISFLFIFNISVMARSIFLKKKYRQRIQEFKCYSINFMAPMCLPYYQTFQTFHHRSWCCVNADPSTVVAKFFKSLLQSFLLFSFFLELHSAVQWVSLECVYACIMIPFKWNDATFLQYWW